MIDDKEFFCDNIRQYESSMYAFALGLLKNEMDAADVIQESILKAYCSLHTLKNKEKFKPWIMSIIHNTAMDFYKKRRYTEDIDEIQEIEANQSTIDIETQMTVWEATRLLKMPYREVIILFYYEDNSIKEIAKITSTSVANVRQQLSRGRKMLAEILNKEDFIK